MMNPREREFYVKGLLDAAKICDTLMHEGEWLAADIREFAKSSQPVEVWLTAQGLVKE
jgi:hypothetical protein